VKCWGDNKYGQLGIGSVVNHGNGIAGGMGKDLPYVDLGTGRTAKAIAVGSAVACAILDNGALKCWGDNEYGALGLGTVGGSIGTAAGQMGDLLSPVALGIGRTAVAVSVSANHTCAVLDDGEAKCWGSGVNGQLGQDSVADSYNPSSLSGINLGGAGAKAISAGPGGTTCAILASGSAKCWGKGDYGALSVSIALNTGGSPNQTNFGDYTGEMASLPVLSLPPGRTAKQIGTGLQNSCALLDNNTITCWGGNSAGQLGLGIPDAQANNNPDDLAKSAPVALGAGRTAKSMAVSSSSVCALLDDGTVKCWGANIVGELGVGNTNTVGNGPNQMGDYLQPVPLPHKAVQISGGFAHACALLDDGTIECWGANVVGQLGANTHTNVGTASGFTLTPVDLAF
jgi:alpha-tubulin suppressor-like RCC1 family protein